MDTGESVPVVFDEGVRMHSLWIGIGCGTQEFLETMLMIQCSSDESDVDGGVILSKHRV